MTDPTHVDLLAQLNAEATAADAHAKAVEQKHAEAAGDAHDPNASIVEHSQTILPEETEFNANGVPIVKAKR